MIYLQIIGKLKGTYREVIGNFTDASPIDSPFRIGSIAIGSSVHLLKKELTPKLFYN